MNSNNLQVLTRTVNSPDDTMHWADVAAILPTGEERLLDTLTPLVTNLLEDSQPARAEIRSIVSSWADENFDDRVEDAIANSTSFDRAVRDAVESEINDLPFDTNDVVTGDNFGDKFSDHIDDAVTDRNLIDRADLDSKIEDVRDEIRNGDLRWAGPSDDDLDAKIAAAVADAIDRLLASHRLALVPVAPSQP